MQCVKCGADVSLESFAFCPICGARQEKKQKKRHARGNKTGSVYQRGNSWVAQVCVGWRSDDKTGKAWPVKVTKSYKTKKDAVNGVQTLLNKKKPTRTPKLDFYWQTYKSTTFKNLSQSKQIAYSIAWKKRLVHLSNIQVTNLDVHTIQETLDGLNLSYYQMKDCKNLLSNLYKLIGADGLASKDIPSFIKLPELKEKEQTPFTADEQQKLWRSFEDGNVGAALPLMMIYTGMMPGEAQKLKVEQINIDEKKIVGAGLKTKTRQQTPIVIADFLIPVIQTLIENARQDGHLFIQSKDDFYQLYYDALEKAEVRKLPPYSCRHTCATALAVDQNVAPQTIKKIMRWSTAKMLDRYAHPTSDDALEAVNKLKLEE